MSDLDDARNSQSDSPTGHSSSRVALLVSDSNSKLAQATAIEFIKLGLKVVITCSDVTSLEARLSEATAGNRIVAYPVDFRNETEVDQVIAKVITKFGRLDILVNNLNHRGRTLSLRDEAFFDEFNTTVQVNLYAATRLAQLAAPYLLRARDGGIIINVLPSSSKESPCCMIREIVREGLSMLTKTLANSFEDQNVRCLAINSSSTLPVMFGQEQQLPSKRNSSSEIANLIVFLTSNKAGYINGTTIEVSTDG